MDRKQKPSIEEVLKYATPQVRLFISKVAIDLPFEQRSEIEQDAYVRLVEAYPELDPEKGWKSFVYNHCRGAALDYLKFGRGFHEQRWSIVKDEEHGSKNVSKIRERLFLVSSEDGTDIEVDQVMGVHGVFSEQSRAAKIRWELLARMSAQDETLHVFAKHLRGIGIDEMVPVFNLCRARIGQLIQAFVARFDDPEQAECPWFLQTCFALGICEELGLPDVDQSEVLGFKIGWGFDPVDLDSLEPNYVLKEQASQMGFSFDEDLSG